MSSKKPAIVLTSTLVIALLIAIWGIFFNQATIIVTSELTPFKVTFGQTTNDCSSSPCSIKVSPRLYEVSIAKGGYSTQTEEVKLNRGDKFEINYTGFVLPRIKPIESAEPMPQGYLAANEAGDQVLYIRTPDQGDIIVTTFRDPLTEPDIRVSPERDYALVWDQQVYPPQYFLVDIPLKTKRIFEFPTNNLPADFKFLDDQNLLLQGDNQVRLFNIETGASDFFPVKNLDQIQAISNNQALIVSGQNLDQFNQIQEQELSFEDILNLSQDDVIIDENSALPGKLYYYTNGTYTFLFQLQDDHLPPYRFFQTQIENQTEIILQSNDNLHLIKTEL